MDMDHLKATLKPAETDSNTEVSRAQETGEERQVKQQDLMKAKTTNSQHMS